MSQSRTKMTWAGQMGQSRTGQDKSPKAGRPAQGWTSGSSANDQNESFPNDQNESFPRILKLPRMSVLKVSTPPDLKSSSKKYFPKTQVVLIYDKVSHCDSISTSYLIFFDFFTLTISLCWPIKSYNMILQPLLDAQLQNINMVRELKVGGTLNPNQKLIFS